MAKKLTDRVKKAQKNLILGKPSKGQPVLSKAALDAITLADQFSSIHPDVYVLPLDAMAGFTAANTKTELVLESAI